MSKHLLTAAGAAMLLGIRERTVQKLVRSKKIPHLILPTGDIRFCADDLLRWATSFKQPGEKTMLTDAEVCEQMMSPRLYERSRTILTLCEEAGMPHLAQDFIANAAMSADDVRETLFAALCAKFGGNTVV